jgi:hypothetical protein
VIIIDEKLISKSDLQKMLYLLNNTNFDGISKDTTKSLFNCTFLYDRSTGWLIYTQPHWYYERTGEQMMFGVEQITKEVIDEDYDKHIESFETYTDNTVYRIDDLDTKKVWSIRTKPMTMSVNDLIEWLKKYEEKFGVIK